MLSMPVKVVGRMPVLSRVPASYLEKRAFTSSALGKCGGV